MHIFRCDRCSTDFKKREGNLTEVMTTDPQTKSIKKHDVCVHCYWAVMKTLETMPLEVAERAR